MRDNLMQLDLCKSISGFRETISHRIFLHRDGYGFSKELHCDKVRHVSEDRLVRNFQSAI
ncbi:hypothetical protein Brsp01_07270 [Brucella sp. NBRC 12950]|nr:hypothetical protein Brsp01_07270 [Brucella sp. NBRC 12950]